MENFDENSRVTPENEQVEASENTAPDTEYAGQNAAPSEEPVLESSETFDAAESAEEAPYTPPVSPDMTYMGRINYTEQKPINDYSPFGKGLKIFCAVLAAVILLTGASATGYFLGKNSNSTSYHKSDVKLDLSSKPKGEDGMTAAEVYEAINPSVVGIRVYNSSSAFDASGIIYTKDGYVITNDHIYSTVGAPKFKIYTFDGKEYEAEYVAGDTVSDLAVLKIKGGKGFKAATFGDSGELVCGESVFAIGRPSDASDGASITAGTISLPKRRVKSTNTSYSSTLIQTDSAINPGSSGGALSNMYGQVVGVTSSKMSGSEYDRIGFAIPTVTVKRVVDQLISNGKVTDRAKLGITYTEVNSVTKEMGNYLSVGLLIQSVNSDSDLYGKVTKNDIITRVNGEEITRDDVMLDVIESCKAGDVITVTVLSSSGTQSDYTVKLGANIGESSFSADEDAKSNSDEENNSSESGGTFNFPFGE